MIYRKYGEPHEGVTFGMVRACIANMRAGGRDINVFVRSIVAKCDLCGDEFLVSEGSDIRMRCLRHRRTP